MSSIESSSSTDFVIINGERMPLMADGRFPVYHYYPVGTALFDPSSFPPTKVLLCGVGPLGFPFESPTTTTTTNSAYTNAYRSKSEPYDGILPNGDDDLNAIPLSSFDERGVTVFRLIPHGCYIAIIDEEEDMGEGNGVTVDVISNINNINNKTKKNSTDTLSIKSQHYCLATAPPLDGNLNTKDAYFNIYKDSHKIAPTLHRIWSLNEELGSLGLNGNNDTTSININKINTRKNEKGVIMTTDNNMSGVRSSSRSSRTAVDVNGIVTTYILVHWVPQGMWESVLDFLSNSYFRDPSDYHSRHHHHKRNNININNNGDKSIPPIVVVDDTRVASKGIACLFVKSYENRLKALTERYLLCSVNINNNVIVGGGGGGGSFYLYFEGTDWKPTTTENAVPYTMSSTPTGLLYRSHDIDNGRGGYSHVNDHHNYQIRGSHDKYNPNNRHSYPNSNSGSNINGRGYQQQRRDSNINNNNNNNNYDNHSIGHISKQQSEVPQGVRSGGNKTMKENIKSFDSVGMNSHVRHEKGVSSSNNNNNGSIVDGNNLGNKRRVSSGTIVSSNGHSRTNGHSSKQPVGYFIAKIPSDVYTESEEGYFYSPHSKLINYKHAIEKFEQNVIVLFVYSDRKPTTLFGHGHVIGLKGNSVKVRWGSKRVDKEVSKIVKESFAIQLETQDSVMFTDSLMKPHLMGDCNELIRQLVSGNWDVRAEKANDVSSKTGSTAGNNNNNNIGNGKCRPVKSVDEDQSKRFINAVKKGKTSSATRLETIKS